MPDRRYIYGDISFIWDEDKNRYNIQKHGISFETAALVFCDDMRLEFEDNTHGDEVRYNTIGLVQDILFVVYVDRQNSEDGEDIRLISARLATKKEAEAYNNIVSGRA